MPTMTLATSARPSTPGFSRGGAAIGRWETPDFNTVNGRERKISKQRAFIKALVAAAIKSDVRAINAVVACARNFGAGVEDEMPAAVDTEDLDILEAFVTRERKRREPDNNNSKAKKAAKKGK